MVFPFLKTCSVTSFANEFDNPVTASGNRLFLIFEFSAAKYPFSNEIVSAILLLDIVRVGDFAMFVSSVTAQMEHSHMAKQLSQHSWGLV